MPLARRSATAYTVRRVTGGDRHAWRRRRIRREERKPSRKVGALRGLVPFLRPYRALVVLAGLALVLTAAVSLILPLAVRRVVDGFNSSNAALLDQYFAAALVIAALLALGTGLRYYLVTRLGERVVADIRRALFDRVVGLSPAFFERIMTGEVRQPHHHRHHADPVGDRLVGLGRAAQRADPGGRAGAAVLHLGQADRAGAADRARRGGADHRAGPPPAAA